MEVEEQKETRAGRDRSAAFNKVFGQTLVQSKGPHSFSIIILQLGIVSCMNVSALALATCIYSPNMLYELDPQQSYALPLILLGHLEIAIHTHIWKRPNFPGNSYHSLDLCDSVSQEVLLQQHNFPVMKITSVYNLITRLARVRLDQECCSRNIPSML